MGRRFAYHIIVVTALLTMFLPSNAQASPLKQGNDCEWIFIGTLAMDPAVNPYADIPLSYTRWYIPPLTRGDRDFYGHGPQVWASVDFHVLPYGIYANVWMKAEETKKDWTTVEGRGVLEFLHLKDGWKIQQVAELGVPGNGSVVPANVSPVYSSLIWNNLYYRDNNHDVDTIPIQSNNLVESIQFVGDTKGNEAGTKTKIIVNSKIAFVCIAQN